LNIVYKISLLSVNNKKKCDMVALLYKQTTKSVNISLTYGQNK